MNTRTRMKTAARSDWRLATAISAILLSSALPQEAAAQSANANLRGKAPGSSEVTATNTDTGLTRRTQVNADGSYVLVGLPPGTYRVSAGPGTEQVVSLSIASTATLDLGGEQAPTALGEVMVSGNRLAEVRTSEVGGGISLRQIEVTPQITRNFLEFADAVPGMQFSVDAKGNTQIRSGTLNTGTTNVYIDGVGQKNYVRPSGVTGRRAPIRKVWCEPDTVGRPGNPFPQLAIAEYKVITSNYKAEYDQVSGAAITAVTKSGTNEFEAGAFMTYTDEGLREETPAEKAAGTGKEGGDSKEYGFSIGGPIIKDKMHFFLTYEAKEFTTPNTVQAPQLFDDNNQELDWVGALTPELRENYGPVANPFDEELFFAQARLGTRLRRSPRAVGQVPRGDAAEPGPPAWSPSPRHRPTSTTTIAWRCAGSTSASATSTKRPSPTKTRTTRRRRTGNEPGRQYRGPGDRERRLRHHPADRRRRSAQLLLLDAERLRPPGRHHVHRLQLAWRPHGQDRRQVQGRRAAGSRRLDRGALFVLRRSRHPRCRRRGGSLPGDLRRPGRYRPRRDLDLEEPPVRHLLPGRLGGERQAAAEPRRALRLRGDADVHGLRYAAALRGRDLRPRYQRLRARGPERSCPAYNFSGGYHGSQPGQTYADTLANAGIDINDYISNGSNRSNPIATRSRRGSASPTTSTPTRRT